MKKLTDGWKPFWPEEAEEIGDFSGAEWKLYTYMRIRAHLFTFNYSGDNIYLAKVLKMDDETISMARWNLRKKGKITMITRNIDHIPKAKFYKEQAIEEIKGTLTNSGKSAMSSGKSAMSSGKSATPYIYIKKERIINKGNLFVNSKIFKTLVRYLAEQNGGRDMRHLAMGTWKKYGEKAIKRGLDVVNRSPNPGLKLFWEAVKEAK